MWLTGQNIKIIKNFYTIFNREIEIHDELTWIPLLKNMIFGGILYIRILKNM